MGSRNGGSGLPTDEELITANRVTLWQAAQKGFRRHGRGTIIIDLSRANEGANLPILYQKRENVQDPKALGMIDRYDPGSEMVIVIVRPPDQASYHRIGVIRV